VRQVAATRRTGTLRKPVRDLQAMNSYCEIFGFANVYMVSNIRKYELYQMNVMTVRILCVCKIFVYILFAL